MESPNGSIVTCAGSVRETKLTQAHTDNITNTFCVFMAAILRISFSLLMGRSPTNHRDNILADLRSLQLCPLLDHLFYNRAQLLEILPRNLLLSLDVRMGEIHRILVNVISRKKVHSLNINSRLSLRSHHPIYHPGHFRLISPLLTLHLSCRRRVSRKPRRNGQNNDHTRVIRRERINDGFEIGLDLVK